MKYTRFLLVFVFVFSVSGKIYSQTADEIVNKYVDAIGGLEKLSAINSLKVTGKFSAGGMDVTFIQTYKRPNMTFMEVTLQGMTMKQAYDGNQGWSINPFMGKKDPDLLPEDQLKQMKRQADFEGQLINYKAKGSSIELLGSEDFEGAQVHKIKLTDKNGDISNFYIDAESFLLLKQTDKMKFESKEVESESIFSDYRPVNGILMPFNMEVKVPESPMGNQKISIDTIEANIPVEDSIFKMPEVKK